MSLENLIKGCKSQDRKSQKALYDAYKDALFTIVLRITGDVKLSEDLLQDTFIDAFRNINSLKEEAYFYSWIRTILIRKTYKYLKSEAKTEMLDDEAYNKHDRLLEYDIDYIEQAILKLPLKCRSVFVMVEIEGFSHKEIAKEMGISIGTSKSQLHFAKSKLKTMLEPILKS